MKTIVKYEPRKEVIIHEYTKYINSDELINASIRGLPTGSVLTALRWVDGVLLSFSSLPINDVTSKELIEGRLHWDHVSFAPMSQYHDQIITGTGVTVIIARADNNPVFRVIAEFLKDTFLRSDRPEIKRKRH